MVLKDPPMWTKPDGTGEYKKDVIYWNAPFVPPLVGSTVRITLNGWEGCAGTVEGYNADHGWLMIWVRPFTRPAWHRQEMPARHVCLFAGIELEPLP